MSPDERQELARRVLTEAQLAAWELAERGMSQRAIAYFQG